MRYSRWLIGLLMIVILVGCDLSALVPGGSSEKSYFGPWQIVEVARPSDPPLMQPEGDAFALDPEWEVASITLVYKWWGLGKPDLVVRRIERQGEGFMSDGQRVSTELVREFFQALSQHAGITLHVTNHYGANAHHIAETCFKAVARALRAALETDPRRADAVPSTKGSLKG